MTQHRCKPGSLLADGSIIDYQGQPMADGPCWVPYRLGASWSRATSRIKLANAAGWQPIGPLHSKYPGIPPTIGVICVIRSAVQ